MTDTTSPLDGPVAVTAPDVELPPPARLTAQEAFDRFAAILGARADVKPEEWHGACRPGELTEAVRAWCQWQRDRMMSDTAPALPTLPGRRDGSGQPVVRPVVDLCELLWQGQVPLDGIETAAQLAVRRVNALTVGSPGNRPEGQQR